MDIPASPSCNSAASPGWDDVRYAVVIARCGSVAGAARQLGVDQTTVARRLRTLEACLGTPLFERLKGQLTPTPMGEELLTRGQRMEAEIAALCHLVSDRQTQVKGVVRITAVDTLASHYLARQLADLRSRYPELAIEIIASSRSLDLGRREADIAVRLARPADGDLVMRSLGRLAYGVYGPEKPLLHTSWQSAPWVGYERALDRVPEMCWLSEHVGQQNVSFRCNNIDALANAVADGLGLGILPCLVGSRHPGLRCLSGSEAVLTREIWLVLPRELRDVPRVRVVGDWLVERFHRDEARFSRTA